MLGEGVLTELLRIVYEIFFSNAPKTPYFTRDFLIAGIAGHKLKITSSQHREKAFLGFIAVKTCSFLIGQLWFFNLALDIIAQKRENHALQAM